MTRIPSREPPELPKVGQQQVVLSYELVTPMYGGGKESQKPDMGMPVRASAIRGQLRAWWRLLASSQYDGKTLRIEEFDLWGGPDKNTPKASRVMLQVRHVDKVKVEPWAKYDKKPDGLYKGLPTPQPWANAAYALFPAQGKASKTHIEQQPHSLIKAGMTFELLIGFSAPINAKQQELLWQSVRWWSQFGGLGARTRRGLGAIQLKQVSDHSLKETLLKNIDAKEAQQQGCSLVKLNRSSRDATQAWTDAIGKLQKFRQIGVGRRSHSNRSFWPEPDAIRRITGQSSKKHEHPVTEGNFFPRAVFGLPIIFKFKDDGQQRYDEPSQTSLQPKLIGEEEPRERMASPMILRPTNDEQGRWYATALLLPYQGFKNVQLNLSYTDKGMQRKCPDGWSVDYLNSQLVANIQPIANHNGTNALDAFMNYFGGN
jgi:CRISPR-associated protein Cmr1